MSKYCGHCGCEIDARIGFCPNCNAEKIHTLWEQPAAQKLQEEIQFPVPAEKPDRKTRKANRKEEKKAAKKAYRATWSVWKKIWHVIWNIFLTISVVWLVLSLLIGSAAYFLFWNPSYVFEMLDQSGLELEQVIEDSEGLITDYLEETDLDFNEFTFFTGEE